MIKTNTLFILGAGASVPFGYLTSMQLRNEIRTLKLMSSIEEVIIPAYEDSIDCAREYRRFVSEFSRSSLYSIDLFLEHRKEFMDMGKMTIAAYLIQFEKDEKLRDSDGNWYMYLYDRLKSSFDDLDKNMISFITFNYDRSLEQFIFEAVRAHFNKPSVECAQKIKAIPIVHLYGQLDVLPWQDREGVGYSPVEYKSQRLMRAIKNIKLISDERDVSKSPEFQKAYKLIEEAKRIYFLGFGFDETNLERLRIELMGGKELLATALGLAPSKQHWIKRYFMKRAGSIDLHEEDSLQLLQKYLPIE